MRERSVTRKNVTGNQEKKELGNGIRSTDDADVRLSYIIQMFASCIFFKWEERVKRQRHSKEK